MSDPTVWDPTDHTVSKTSLATTPVPSLALWNFDQPAQVGVPMIPTLDVINLLEWFTELRETLISTGLL